MTNEERIFQLYVAHIASDTKDTMTYDQCYDAALEANAFFTQRNSLDSVLPTGVSSSKFKKAAKEFVDKNTTQKISNFDGLHYLMPNNKVIGMVDHFKFPLIKDRFDVYTAWGLTLRKFLQRYLSKEYIRELYDYMHDMKFITF